MGTRLVKLEDFYTGVRKTVLQANEMVLEVQFKALSKQHRGTFIKFALRKAQAISIVNIAVVLEMVDGIAKDVRIAYGAVSPIIHRMTELERMLLGKKIG